MAPGAVQSKALCDALKPFAGKKVQITIQVIGPENMRGDFDEDELEDYEYDYADDFGCQTCGGAGFIMVCIDDMCRGAGECMHGDGEIPCPECCGDD